MILKVKYFGMIAEWIGSSEQSVDCNGSTVRELKEQLESQYPKLSGISYQVAISHKISSNDQVITEQDELALLPPFAGG